MTTAQVNYLNIAFMILSCIVAFVLPFELFLFSYAILGPLHYLTEMSWLRQRHFFTPGRRDYLLLAALALVIIFPFIFKALCSLWGTKDVAGNAVYNARTLSFLGYARAVSKVAIFISFGVATVMVLIRHKWKRLIGIIVVVIFAILFRTQAFITILFALFVPTLIHVFIFTGVFMLNGAIKTRSFSGYLSLLIFIACAAALLLVRYYSVSKPGNFVLDNYEVSFATLNRQIFDTFLHRDASHNDIYFSGTGILITRFIAYAYTYHYLNWFSKTSVIRWHLVPKPTLVLIVLLWGLSLLLYFTNYRTGLAALYFLSVLHVIFEFPLNVQSFREIAGAILPSISNTSK